MLLLIPFKEYLLRLAEPRSIADVLLVFLLVYGVLKLLRGTRAAAMAAGIGVFAFLYWLAVYGNLTTLEFVLRGALLYIGVAVIVLFQTEIRQGLIRFGNQFRRPFTRRQRGQFGQGIYDEIVLAATTLASTKTGALIVIERNVGLKSIVDAGVGLDARLSYDLLVSIFNPASPLHDGAVIVRGDRIAAASCFLPLSLNPLSAQELGTRHRAALGITEDSDAVAVVVSEETGLVSFVRRGRLKRALDPTRLRAAIYKEIERQDVPRKTMIDPHATESAEVESVM
ncbi:MAG TPA: diadenylate cyclase CdaA [Pyrinomonadaceae bacterium]|jgi:diadenylate cyclase|nr:diadenylate cyclase CdaA [Pyrinomonadaceae bacterium]